MTDKEILKAFREQFNTGNLFTESNVLVLMGYARGDARKIFIENLPSDDDIEMEILEIIDDWYQANGNQNDNTQIIEGIRIGTKMIKDWILQNLVLEFRQKEREKRG